MQPAAFGGFAISRSLSLSSRKSGPHAPDCAHMASLPDYRPPINPTGRNACMEGRPRLDGIAGDTVFGESEQSKNEAGEMVPLYAARVQDLEIGDFVVFKCGACGHTAEIPQSGFIRGLGLKPTARALDLERRLCDAKKAVVSVKWRAAG
jgi:hypothetical protein